MYRTKIYNKEDISTRYNLNQSIYDKKYAVLNPQINLISEIYKYEPKDYNYLNDTYQLNQPTEEEIKQSEIYQNQIPDYQVSKQYGDNQPGVIIHKPFHSNYPIANPTPSVTYKYQRNNNFIPNQISQNININTSNNNKNYGFGNNTKMNNNNFQNNCTPKSDLGEYMTPLISSQGYNPP